MNIIAEVVGTNVERFCLQFHLSKAIDLCRHRAREGAEGRRRRSRRSRDGTPVAPDPLPRPAGHAQTNFNHTVVAHHEIIGNFLAWQAPS